MTKKIKSAVAPFFVATLVLFSLFCCCTGIANAELGLIGPTLPHDLMVSPSRQGSSSVYDVAFDGSRYLALHTGPQLYGRFVNQAGTLENQIQILPSAVTASLAYAGGHYLVVYLSDLKHIYAKTITPEGQMSDPIEVMALGSTDGSLGSVHVDTNGQDFLVVWQRTPQMAGSDLSWVQGRVVSSAGTPSGSAFDICPRDKYTYNPSVTYGGGKYLVAYRTQDTAPANVDLYATLVSASPNNPPIVGDRILIAGGPNYQGDDYPSAAFNGNDFLIGWADSQARSAYVARLSIDGVLHEGPLSGWIKIGDKTAGPSIGFDGTNWLVLFGDFSWAPEQWTNIYGVRIGPDGTILDSKPIRMQEPRTQLSSTPRFTFGQDKAHAFLMWSSWEYYNGAYPYTTYGQLIGPVTTPSFPPPVADAGPDQTANVNSKVILDGSDSYDPDNNLPLVYYWDFISKPEGSSAVVRDSSLPTAYFTPDKAGDYEIRLTVKDSYTLRGTDTVKITASVASNQAPIANAGADQIITVNTMATLDGSGSRDPDNNLPLQYTWSVTSRPTGSTAQLSSTSVAKPTFIPDKTGEYQFSLLVKDSLGLQSQAAATVKLTANPPVNQAPIANAGSDQIITVNTMATLDGSGSRDPDNNLPLAYAWSVTSRPTGSTAALSSATVAKPTFTPDNAGDYVFSLTVKDSLGLQSQAAATVKITATPPPNQAPIADAGADRTVSVGTAVTLDGTASHDPDNNLPLSYEWSITSKPTGSGAQLSSSTADKPTFTPDKTGDYEVQLTVKDSLGLQSQPIKVKITASNQPPVANAGDDQTVDAGVLVTLDGTKSADPDNNLPLSYEWSVTSKPDSSNAQLSSTTVAKPTFTPDKSGNYMFALYVTDSQGLKSATSDTVTIRVNNQAPVADAGSDQSVNLGTLVTLDGTASHDPDNNGPLTFAWSIASRPADSNVQLSSSTADKPTFTPDKPGQYTIQLIVKDSLNAVSQPATMKVMVNNPPTANAGADQTVNVGTMVSLDGTSSSDAESNFPLTYEWSITSRPTDSAAQLSSTTAEKPTLTPDKPGDYEVQLVVTDSLGAGSDPIKVKITANNQPPIADAGTDQSVIVGTLVTLDGTRSHDPDGNIPLKHAWMIIGKPDGSNVQLSSSTADQPTLLPDKSGEYTVQLVVTDSLGLQSQPVTMKIAANSRPTADAGTDQAINVGTLVILDGTKSSDPDNNVPLTYEWTMTGKPDGSNVQLSSSAADKPTFTPDKAGDYVFSLVVEDSRGAASASATVKVTANTPPTVDAGADQPAAHLGDSVSLKATASDADGNSLSYLWTVISRPDNSNPTLTGGSTAEPQLTPDKLGTYQLEVTVLDGKGGSATDTISVTVVNQPPTADAGDPQSIHVGKLVALDGTGSSDPEGQKLSYSWSLTERPDGSTATLTDADTATPQLTPDVPGDYVVGLTVTDTEGATSTASVKISTTNTPPIADAGLDKSVQVIGSTVTLDGSKSYDNDGDSMSYAWTLVSKPADSKATLSGADLATPAFFADVHGTYVVRLVVSDRWAGSVPDEVTVSFDNLKPVANAGTGQVGVTGQKVTLQGSGTDANGDALTYSWAWSSVPDGSQAQLSSTTSATPTFVPDKPGTYVAQLIVNDGFADSDASTVQIEVVTQATKVTNDVKAVQATISSPTFSTAVKNPTMPKALTNKLNAVTESISSGDRQAALDQLNELLAKTDGCRNGGTPDKNDWVTTCSAQQQVYGQLVTLINEVQQL